MRKILDTFAHYAMFLSLFFTPVVQANDGVAIFNSEDLTIDYRNEVEKQEAFELPQEYALTDDEELEEAQSLAESFLTGKKSKSKKHAKKYFLALASVFQNEAPYMKEWIEYYAMLGVDRFYLYNNKSSDNYLEVLDPYIKNGLVVLIDWPMENDNLASWNRTQVLGFQNSLVRARKDGVKWLALLDLDEYLVPIRKDSIKDLLNFYEQEASPETGGICFMYVFFGTSGVKKIPANKLMIETLTFNGDVAANNDPWLAWERGLYKSIAKVDCALQVGSQHYFVYRSPYKNIMPLVENAQINHYWTKDEEFFYNVKVPRREVWGDNADALRESQFMGLENQYSLPILRFVPELRKRMGLQ